MCIAYFSDYNEIQRSWILILNLTGSSSYYLKVVARLIHNEYIFRKIYKKNNSSPQMADILYT